MAEAITPEGLAKLKAELEELEGEGRRAIAARILSARELGDLSENAEYHAAKDAQAHLETRIQRLREQVTNSVVVKATSGEVAGLGSTVEVTDPDGNTRVYKLVSAHEGNPGEGLLSIDSPVGTALLGKRAGDKATAQVPSGARKLNVISVS
jgi:transcription elongation factor GreA